MKHIFRFILILLLSAACKKNKEKPTEILLSEIKIDGAASVRVQYSSDNKITSVDRYAAGALSTRFAYKYNAAGNVSELTAYTFPGEVPVQKVQLECDNLGRIVHTINYELQGGSPNTPTSTATYSYNTAGLLSKVERRDKDDKFLFSVNYTYYPDGGLEEMQFFRPSAGLLWLSDKAAFSITNGSLPKGIDQLSNLVGPEYSYSFVSESSQNYRYNQAGALTTQSSNLMSAREFNEDGSLSKQVRTTTFQKPIQPKEESHMEFVYLIR